MQLQFVVCVCADDSYCTIIRPTGSGCKLNARVGVDFCMVAISICGIITGKSDERLRDTPHPKSATKTSSPPSERKTNPHITTYHTSTALGRFRVSIESQAIASGSPSFFRLPALRLISRYTNIRRFCSVI